MGWLHRKVAILGRFVCDRGRSAQLHALDPFELEGMVPDGLVELHVPVTRSGVTAAQQLGCSRTQLDPCIRKGLDRVDQQEQLEDWFGFCRVAEPRSRR